MFCIGLRCHQRPRLRRMALTAARSTHFHDPSKPDHLLITRLRGWHKHSTSIRQWHSDPKRGDIVSQPMIHGRCFTALVPQPTFSLCADIYSTTRWQTHTQACRDTSLHGSSHVATSKDNMITKCFKGDRAFNPSPPRTALKWNDRGRKS